MSASAADPRLPRPMPSGAARAGRLAGVLLLGAALWVTQAAAPAVAQPLSLQQPATPAPATPAPAEGQATEADPAPAPVQPSGPLRLTPFGQPATSGTPGTAPAPTAPRGMEVEALGALSADGGGTLAPGNGGLPADAWAGTARPLAEGLIATLPDTIRSAALRDGLTRLLLSDIAPPPGEPGGRGFAAQRLDRLARLGHPAAAASLAGKVPAAAEDEAAALSLVTAQLLAGEPGDGCPRVNEGVRRFQDTLWLKLQIACQVRAGEMAAATLAVDLLREQGDGDADFMALAESAITGRTAPVRGVAQPTAAQLALILASKRSPAPETRVSGGPALAALARAPEVPIQMRLSAAEAAAALGLLSPSELAAVYQSVSIADNELRDPLTAATRRQGAQARALLVQALRNASSAGVKAELLRQVVLVTDVPLLTGNFGALLMQELGQIPPGSAHGFIAPAAARLALLQGRPELARPWVDVARAELAGGNAEAASFHRLWPLALLNGLARPEDVEFDSWLAGLGATPEDPEALHRAAAIVALLAASEVALARDAVDALLVASRQVPAGGVATPVDPLMAVRILQVGVQSREAETMLLAAHLVGPGGPTPAGAWDTLLAVESLRAAGLRDEARRLATELAATLLAP